jgi:transposase-like protein
VQTRAAGLLCHNGVKMTAAESDLFKGRHFDQQVIVLCVRWYISYKLSSRDLVRMMDERGIELAHTTILRWVQRYVPEFEKRWGRYARSVGDSWRCDETYIKEKGHWTSLYRAVDKQGRTVDFLLTAKRDVAAAKRFFQKAMRENGAPRVITLDAYVASHRAVRELRAQGRMPKRVRVRSSKYLNNGIEQDHRGVKQRIRPMLGFKRFETAAITISGIELAAKIKKHQFKVGKLSGRPNTIPQIWAAVLAA